MASSWQAQGAQAPPGKAEHAYTPAQRPGDLQHCRVPSRHSLSPCLQARLPFHHPNLLSSRAEWEHGSRKQATELLLQGERKHLGLQENVHMSRRAQTQQPFLTTHVFPQISHHHSCSPTLLSPQTRSALDCKHVTAACARGGQLIACPAFLQCSHCSAHHNHFCNTTDSWCLCQAVTTAPMARDLLACYRSTHAAHPPLHLPALTVSQLGIHPASGTLRCSPALGENNTAHLAAMQRLDLKTHLVSDSPLQPLTTVLESFPTPLLDPLPHSTLDSPHPIPCYPSTLPSGCPSLFPGPGSWQVGLALLFVGTDPFCSSCRVRCLAHGSS